MTVISSRTSFRMLVGIVLASTLSIASYAQRTFTQHLTLSEIGAGEVTLQQDAEIDALVNGQTLPASRPNVPANPALSANGLSVDSAMIAQDVQATGRRARVSGYRIQVYAGGNNRQSKAEAQRMANTVRSYFADVPVYTHFVSPRWICRVGDFKTYEEANELLRQMRQTSQFKEASIVKTKITVFY